MDNLMFCEHKKTKKKTQSVGEKIIEKTNNQKWEFVEGVQPSWEG